MPGRAGPDLRRAVRPLGHCGRMRMLAAALPLLCGGERGGGLSARSVRSAQAPPGPRAQQQWRRCSGAGIRPNPSETAMGWTSLVRFKRAAAPCPPRDLDCACQRTGAGRRGPCRLRCPSWRGLLGRQARFAQTWRVKFARDGLVALAAGVGIVFKSGPDEALFVKVGVVWPCSGRNPACCCFLGPGFASHPRSQRRSVALGMCCGLTFECGTCTWPVAARPWRTMARQPCTGRSKSTTACSSVCVFALLRPVRSSLRAPACLRVLTIVE